MDVEKKENTLLIRVGRSISMIVNRSVCWQTCVTLVSMWGERSTPYGDMGGLTDCRPFLVWTIKLGPDISQWNLQYLA